MTLPALLASAQGTVYYSTDFNTSSLASIGFSTIDANNDGTVWTPQTTKNSFRNLDGQSITAVEMTPTSIANQTNDDWLLTPSIRFESGKTYDTEFLLAKYAYAAVENSMEICLGTSKNASSMTTVLVTASECGMPQFGGNSLWTKRATITVDQTGDYFIGIHAIGKPGQKIAVASIKIAPGIGQSTPAAVSNLTVTPDPTGDKKATISFTAPSFAKDGSELTSLTKIEVRRGDDLVKVIDNPAPGSGQSVVDMVPINAEYTYRVTAFSEAGGGDPATASAFIGINIPGAVSDIKAENTSNISAIISWSAPAADKDGNNINPSLITYDVYAGQLYSSSYQLIASGISETETTFTRPEPAEGEEEPQQSFYSFKIVAKTAQGDGETAQINIPVPLGIPYEVPFMESFANGRVSTIYTAPHLQGNNYWQVTRDFEDVSSADGDNGMVFLNGQIGGSAAFITGLIDLSGMASPTLSYYTYALAGCDPEDHRLQLIITTTDGQEKEYEMYTPAAGWNKTLIPLNDFIGKTVRLRFDGYRLNNTELFLDAISIANIYSTDIETTGIHMPSVVRSDEPFDVIVDVLNAGSTPVASYKVDLYNDGNLVDSYSGVSLPIGAYDHVAFQRVHGILDPETISYYAVVSCDGDMDAANNRTETIESILRKNSYPTVSDLNGEIADGVLTLVWSEPDTSDAQPYETLETFESYPSWATQNVGDWIFVDRDQAQISGFIEAVMPGIDNYSQQSWWIFDNSSEDFNNGSFATLSGNRFLASMVSGILGQGYVQNDDWAISPALFGGAQTVTVNARSYSILDSEFESFEILWSDGSTNPDDFTLLQRFENIPSEYQEYSAELPEGARRFAIRNISLGKYVLMVDDVTYIGVGDPASFSINGYNVYRDGIRLNDEPVEENEFVVENPVAGDYQVSVLYSAGESRLSNAFNPEGLSVGTISAEQPQRAELFNLQGQRVSNPAPGIYIMRKGSESRKVIIR